MYIAENSIHDEFRGMIRRFARERVLPFATEIDRDKRPPVEAFTAAAELGLQGLPYPEHLGGQDGDMLSQSVMVEEISRVCASTSLTISSCWILMAVVNFGTEQQQQDIVTQVTRHGGKCAWGLTEPKGGSDLMAASTRAEKVDGGWVINGTKRFITNGGWADWYLIFARTSEKGFGLFLVNKSDEGVSFGAPERKMGMRGSPTSDVILEDVFVSEDRLLGDPARGATYIVEELTRSRIHMASHALGIAAGALDEAVSYTDERNQFGQPVSRFQMVRGMVADMSIRVESARAVLHRAAMMVQDDHPDAKLQASIAKVACSDAAMAVTTDAVQLHGGYGYLEDYPVERMMRDAKVTQIWEGTNQIQRLMIAKGIYDARR